MTFDLSVLGIDRGSLEAGIGTLLASELAPVMKLAAEDLKDFGFAIARDGVAAMIAGDHQAIAELKGQMKALAEIQRIRVELVDWDLTQRVVMIVFKAAAAAIGAAIPRP